MKKIKISMYMGTSYFYNEGEEYLVVNGTAVAWEVAEGEHKGRLIAHGHSKVIEEL